MEKLKETLKQIAELRGDPEISHVKADEALIEYINDAEVTNLFNSIERWYA